MSSNNNLTDYLPSALEEKIGQLINVRIGSNLPPLRTVDEDAERIAELIDRCPIGGLTLFNGRWPSTREVLQQLQAAASIPLLVGSDIERGCGQQMHGMSVLPHAGAFGAASDRAQTSPEELAYQFGEATAIEARTAGIHVAFAPVADTNTNPRNPIIAIRSFGSTTAKVSDMVAGFVKGCEAQNVATAAKHFPGHGDTEQDSHDSLPLVSRDAASIAATELPPFQSAVAAKCSMIMTAHVAYPALDPGGLPATLSSAILQDLLREQLGFHGVICSDSLLMSGVRDRFDSEGEMCLAAILAGVDWLLDVDDPLRVIDYLAGCVAEGRLDEARIDQSVQRIAALKQRVCLQPIEATSAEAQSCQPQQLAERVASQAITSFGAEATPLTPDAPVTCLLAKPFETPLDPPEQPLAAALRETFAAAEYFELSPSSTPDQQSAARKAAEQSKQLILAMIVKPAAWHQFGLLEYQLALFQELATKPGAVIISLGVSEILAQFPDAASKLCTFSDVAVSQRAVVRYLAEGT
ncbi:glycoside hydrolase family 3 protein [Aeoliella sp.]|uniref:glycoside hydrolase family 3 protein n=1 Tax=Aeoliella sp. TaxID=2795800 RepID=UPI003CCC1650